MDDFISGSNVVMSERTDNPLVISLVIPVFNESSAVDFFITRVNQVFAGLHDCAVEFVFVDDGSTDDTLIKLLHLHKTDDRIVVIELTRNFGKEAALTAGIANCSGDVVVPIDVDLQDPPEIIPEMLIKWREGYDVVLGHRIDRSSDSRMKRLTANGFHRTINRLSKVKIPQDVGDFRLMDKSVVSALQQLPENHRFMKGLFAWLGFKTATIDYVRPVRVAGKSAFNGIKLWALALEGITSFSLVPLKIWTYIGFIFSFCSLGYAATIMIKKILFGIDVPGYASLIVAVTFIGGLQLMGIGIIGEYLGRTFMEAKRRPVYLARKIHRKKER